MIISLTGASAKYTSKSAYTPDLMTAKDENKRTMKAKDSSPVASGSEN